jgi:hypothetical protein
MIIILPVHGAKPVSDSARRSPTGMRWARACTMSRWLV